MLPFSSFSNYTTVCIIIYSCSQCRQVAEEVLWRLPPGSFLVRESRTHAHSFALSMKDPSCAIVHHLILKGSTGYHLKV